MIHKYTTNGMDAISKSRSSNENKPSIFSAFKFIAKPKIIYENGLQLNKRILTASCIFSADIINLQKKNFKIICKKTLTIWKFIDRVPYGH